MGNLIGDVLDGLSLNPDDNSKVEKEVKSKVKSLWENFLFIVLLYNRQLNTTKKDA